MAHRRQRNDGSRWIPKVKERNPKPTTPFFLFESCSVEHYSINDICLEKYLRLGGRKTLKKNDSQLLFLFLLANLLACVLNVQSAAASGDIYIRADGSIDPSTSRIQRNVNVYTFTDNIDGQIIVQRDNVVINGAGHTLQGTGVETGIDLSSRTNVTIQNMAIKTFDDALYLHSSNQITISGTSITDSTDGIRVSDSSNNSIYENNITGNSYEGIYILASSNNTISENNITANTGDGVFVWGSSNNTIFGNNISNNWWGITSYYSTNNKIFHNNFINNPSQAYVESSVDIWDEGYPSGGNYWNDYSGTDHRCGPSQDHPGSDGMGDTPNIIDGSNRDNYPLMNPWTAPSGHNVAVISAVSAKTVIGQGYSGNITVYGANKGEYPETLNVTIYANTTSITSMAVPLGSGSPTAITFSWKPTNSSFPKGNYTISAYAMPVSGETNLNDNNFTDGQVIVSMAGDLTGGGHGMWDPDSTVDGSDIILVARCFGSYPGAPPPLTWFANCDITNDNAVDGSDLIIVARHFGQSG
jgi:parallel beta-helix repeat protein